MEDSTVNLLKTAYPEALVRARELLNNAGPMVQLGAAKLIVDAYNRNRSIQNTEEEMRQLGEKICELEGRLGLSR